MGLIQRLSGFLAPEIPEIKAMSGNPGGDVSGWGNTPWAWNSFPSSRINFESEAGDRSQNAIVASTLQWVCRTFPDAPPVVKRLSGEQWETEPKHRLTDALNQPNPWYNGLLMLQPTLWDFNLDGNCLWLIFESQAGDLELWYEPRSTWRPIIPKDGKEFISGYEIYRGGSWDWRIDRTEAIHFRNGIDPQNPRMGLSPLRAALREIFTDNEAANWTASLLRNSAVPSLVFLPKGDTTIPADRRLELKRDLSAMFTGDRRGETLVGGSAAEITQLGFTPEQMNLEKIRHIPEERITSLLGVPAIVVGLGAGLDKATYSNYEQAQEAAWKNNLLPTMRLLAAQLNADLLPRLGDPETERLVFDTSHVAALSEDQNDLWSRVSTAYKSGVIKRKQALALIGQEFDESHDDVYVTDLVQTRQTIRQADDAGQIQVDPATDTLKSRYPQLVEVKATNGHEPDPPEQTPDEEYEAALAGLGTGLAGVLFPDGVPEQD